MALNKKLHSNDGAEKVDAMNYRSLVGRFHYLTNTRLDIVHPVSLMLEVQLMIKRALLATCSTLVQNQFFGPKKGRKSWCYH